MRRDSWRRVIAAGAILGSVLLVQALPAEAATPGPTVIAVHRDGAVDVSGNGTFGTVAKMSVPAGNWSISVSATIVGTDTTSQDECQLVAGAESYKTRTLPSAQGPASSQGIVLLLAHHFAKTGTVTLKCYTDGWTGDVLIRDVHVVAVKVAKLVDLGAGGFDRPAGLARPATETVTGTGSPEAFYEQDTVFTRHYLDTSPVVVDNLSVDTPGTWLVNATLWGEAGVGQPRVDCSLEAGTTTIDQSFENFEPGERTISMEGVFTSSGDVDFEIGCSAAIAPWVVFGSAISAIQVGTLKYGQLGGTLSSSGSGSPTVTGGYGDIGGISDATSPASIANLSLDSGSWFLTSKLSAESGGGTPKVTCQLRLSTASSQARADLDGSGNVSDSMSMSLTKKVTAKTNASVACNQSAGSLGAFYFDLKIFAIKAGTLTDTELN